jgi:Protein of unknown function (DUF3800)
MSTRFFYVDESYDEKRFCLSAICILDRNWHECFRLVREHRNVLKQDHGLFIRKEIHARELVSGRGRISDQVVGKHTRTRIFHGLLQLVATLPETMLFNVCLERQGRRDPQLDAWDRLLNRIERTMLHVDNSETLTRKKLLATLHPLVTSKIYDSIEPRLLRFAARAVIVADESRETEITKVFRKMTVFNPIPSQFGGWVGGKSKNIPLERIIEDPVFKKSQQSFFIQLADCVAFALLKRESKPTPHVAKYQIDKFFDQCLPGVCFKYASPRDALGIVRT